jgi:hypothetical protein
MLWKGLVTVLVSVVMVALGFMLLESFAFVVGLWI